MDESDLNSEGRRSKFSFKSIFGGGKEKSKELPKPEVKSSSPADMVDATMDILTSRLGVDFNPNSLSRTSTIGAPTKGDSGRYGSESIHKGLREAVQQDKVALGGRQVILGTEGQAVGRLEGLHIQHADAVSNKPERVVFDLEMHDDKKLLYSSIHVEKSTDPSIEYNSILVQRTNNDERRWFSTSTTDGFRDSPQADLETDEKSASNILSDALADIPAGATLQEDKS